LTDDDGKERHYAFTRWVKRSRVVPKPTLYGQWASVRRYRLTSLKCGWHERLRDDLFTNQEDDKYGKLTVVDIPREVATRQPWFNQTLTTVNDAVVRLGIFEGEFPWHKHDDQDEFFLVLEGEFYMDAEV